MVVPYGTTAERPTAPVEAAMRYNTDTLSLEYFNGDNWVNVAKSGQSDVSIIKSVSDGLTDTFGIVPATVNAATDVLVFIGGILQVATENFSIVGTNLIFTSIPPANLPIVLIANLNSTYVPTANIYTTIP